MEKTISQQKEYRRAKKHYKLKLLHYFLGNKCVDCGVANKLQFDHINPETKSFTIATNLGLSMVGLMIEILKCQLLCQNCHTIKTLGDRKKEFAKHGTVSRYNNQHCRCDKCTQAKAEYFHSYKLSVGYKAYRKRTRKLFDPEDHFSWQ